jgi:hypothetical protein
MTATPARRLAVLLGVIVALGVSACGSEDAASERAESPATQQPAETQSPAREETSAPTTAPVAERPGCGELCQNAGPPAGTDEPGCPGDDSDNCLPCPEGGCAELLSGSAEVNDGIFTVRMGCKVDACIGAFHVYVPGTISQPVAASDVNVPPGEPADVNVALTRFGRHVLGVTGEFRGSVYVFLEGTGVDELGRSTVGPTLRLSSAREPLVPCGGGIEVTANTSCPFAQNVLAAFASGKASSRVHSPTTNRTYRMDCVSDMTTVYCAGGDDAFVTFPQTAADGDG